ncbi:hypothetical protein MTR67_044032 [Solanum verrucosum]|uniref:O-acyltransferase WSD1 C-terminal domain-containing protein n=1 Tax=Solanum verrucosum TaxID=315347 RepID=A0AAF0UQI2_SOLVR|nr:hypothetical protein MTR67_044032 [Solanum verrucosum]
MMENGSKGKRGWGNWFGYALLPLKIALRDDPLDYVKEAKAAVDRKKRSFEALFTLTMAELLIKVARTVTFRGFSNSTICFTNLVGPQEEIGFCGNPITYFAPSARYFTYMEFIARSALASASDLDLDLDLDLE